MARGGGTATVLTVVLLALLAGCSGVAGPGATASPTVTPAPVATPTGFSPGVTAGGVNVSTVLSTHTQQLSNRSYTVERRIVVRNTSERSVEWRKRTVSRVTPGGSPYVVTTNYSEPRPDGLVASTLYYNGTTTRQSRYANGSRRFEQFDHRTSVDLTNAVLLRRILFHLDDVRVRRGPAGRTVVTGVVSFPRVLPQPPTVSAAGTATASIRIRPDGLIDRVAVGYDTRSGGGARRVRLAATVSAVGTTDVGRPRWAATASSLRSEPID